jgi:hypothetical protein
MVPYMLDVRATSSFPWPGKVSNVTKWALKTLVHAEKSFYMMPPDMPQKTGSAGERSVYIATVSEGAYVWLEVIHNMVSGSYQDYGGLLLRTLTSKSASFGQ